MGLLSAANRHTGKIIDHVVLTVPVDWGAVQHDAMLHAAHAAGLLESVRLLQEPVAAALAHGLGSGLDGEVVLVLDVGGGTTDISILQAFEGAVEVLGTAGSAFLGGDDVDTALASRLFPDHGPVTPDRLRRVEAAKIALSEGGMDCVILGPEDGGTLCRAADLDGALPPFLQALAALLETLGKRLGVEWCMAPNTAATHASQGLDPPAAAAASWATSADAPVPSGSIPGGTAPAWSPPPLRVTRVLCVGQSTRLPCLHRFLAHLTGRRPSEGVDPAHAVAAGAAVYAGMLLGSVPALEIVEGPFAAQVHGRVSGF